MGQNSSSTSSYIEVNATTNKIHNPAFYKYKHSSYDWTDSVTNAEKSGKASPEIQIMINLKKHVMTTINFIEKHKQNSDGSIIRKVLSYTPLQSSPKQIKLRLYGPQSSFTANCCYTINISNDIIATKADIDKLCEHIGTGLLMTHEYEQPHAVYRM